jgi:type IV secretory pathway VirJ component
MPIIVGLKGTRMLCIFGVEDERNAICPELPKGLVTMIERPGGHRPADHAHVSDPILAALGGADRPTRRP